MTHTAKYQLPQWVQSDRILMEDFNQAMVNIENGIDGAKNAGEQAVNQLRQSLDSAIGTGGKTARITTGSYVGTGYIGRENAVTVNVDFKPLVAMVGLLNDMENRIMFRPSERVVSNTANTTQVFWEDRSVGWYTAASGVGGRDIEDQLNQIGLTYYYVIIGESD